MHEYIVSLFFVLKSYGLGGLIIIALTEPSFLPVFPDLLLVPLCLANPEKSITYALIASVSSAVGALAAYYFGKFVGHALLSKLFANENMQKLERIMKKYGALTVLISGFAPITFKLFTIASGIFEVKLNRVFLAALVGRGIRFLLEAILIMYYGAMAISIIRTHFINLSIALTVLIGIGIVVYNFRGKLINDNTKG